MLKILFSPSEGKNSGGQFGEQKLFGPADARKEILDAYNEVVLSGDEERIKALFGFKKFSECEPYINDIYNSARMPAIERYSGVAYEYLQYQSLPKSAKDLLQAHTIIFSNLYGPILGGDTIANYKVKQGNNIGTIAPDKFYKEHFSHQLDLYLLEHDVLDLRAGYYEKFYKVSKPYTTLKFLKNSKSVSHWAKAYRGIVLREIAKNNIDSLEAFQKLEIENLSLHDIKQIKNKTEIVYNITE